MNSASTEYTIKSEDRETLCPSRRAFIPGVSEGDGDQQDMSTCKELASVTLVCGSQRVVRLRDIADIDSTEPSDYVCSGDKR